MNIDIHDVRDFAIKGIGLYCLGYVVNVVPSMIFSLAMPDWGSIAVALAGSFFIVFGYTALGFFCVFRTRAVMRLFWRGDEPVTKSPPLSTLAAMVSLFGIYFAIRAARLVAFYAWEARYPSVYSVGCLVGAIVSLAAALWLVRRPRPIAEFIQRRQTAQT